MKASIAALTCCFLATSSFSQSVDLDRFSFTTAYRDLPSMPVDTSFHTYDFRLQTGPMMRLLNRPGTEETLFIDGWLYAENGGDISVSLFMEDLLIAKSEVDVREEIKKDKTGKIVARNHFYAPILTYTYSARMEVRDRLGNRLQTAQLVNRARQFEYKGAEHGNRSAAENLLLNQFQLTTEISQLVLNRTIRQLSQDLTWQYGYAERRVSDQIWLLDSRKHPEYNDFRSHWGNIRNGLFRLQPDQPVDAVRESLAGDIAYFEKLPLLYSGKDKGSRKLRYAAYFILAKLYLYLDDPESSAAAANRLALNDYDSRDGYSLENAANALRESFRLNKRNSRHFPLYFQSMAFGQKKY